MAKFETAMNFIYLDNNSTTHLDPVVATAMHECALAGLANPASQHRLGQAARRTLEQARETIATILGGHMVGMRADRLILTSGGTEANNLALTGLVGSAPMAGQPPPRVIVSAIEHPSVLAAAEALGRAGFEICHLAVTRDGVADLDHLRELLIPETRLVSVMLANHETGVIQPVREIVQLAREKSVPVHADAVQAAGKLMLNFHEWGLAAMTVTPHKFHGPVGIGALLLRHDVTLNPLTHGGFQQSGLRPGTEPVALAVGFRVALEQWQAAAAERWQHMQTLRDQFERTLLANGANIVVQGSGVERLPQVSYISFVGLDRQRLLLALDRAGIACSSGPACASGSSQPSPVLRAMQVPEEQIRSALRFSVSARTTLPEVTEACQRILHVINDLRLTTRTGK